MARKGQGRRGSANRAVERAQSERLNEAEVDAIIADPSKEIATDIVWSNARPNQVAQAFWILLTHDSPAQIHVRGWFNPVKANLSFSLIAVKQRIYGLDMTGRHRNKDGQLFRGMHKQRWSDAAECAEAFVPDDITARWSEPRRVWEQFCTEARITHVGTLEEPEWQLETFK